MAARRLKSTGLEPGSAPGAPLTPEEDERQRVAGKRFRKLLTKVVGDLAEHAENPAIFLSGGADSASVLMVLSELGVKPDCITYSIGGHMSGDAKKAKHLAEYYGLPFHVVNLESDPDRITEGIDVMLSTYTDIDVRRRPNIEVLYIMQQMFVYAGEHGFKSVFSGIGDADFHLLGRSHEIAGRTKGIGPREATALQVWHMEDDQVGPLSQIASANGIALCAPITIATAMIPYMGLSWREMNIPRKKWVTIRPFEKELDKIGLLIQPKPLQNGDSGARDYFDNAVRDSTYADRRSGRPVDSAQMYYNSIAKSKGIEKERGAAGKKNNVWETWRKNVEGIEPSQKGYEPAYEVDEHGVAVPPEVSSSGGEGGLFGSVMASVEGDELILNDDGEPDTRTDCFGMPFYSGEALTNCPRAKAALCGSHRPDNPVVIEACQFFERWAEAAPLSLESIAKGMDNKAIRKVYKRWDKKAREHAEKITENAQKAQQF